MTASPPIAGQTSPLVLAVRVANERYVVPLEYVDEVLPELPRESFPDGPLGVVGAVRVRGRLLPLFEASRCLRVARHVRPEELHLLCLNVEGCRLAVEVDEALDILTLRVSAALGHERLGLPASFFAGLVDAEGEVLRWLDPRYLCAVLAGTSPGDRGESPDEATDEATDGAWGRGDSPVP